MKPLQEIVESLKRREGRSVVRLDREERGKERKTKRKREAEKERKRETERKKER